MTGAVNRQFLNLAIVAITMLVTACYAQTARAGNSSTTQPSDSARLIGTWQTTLPINNLPVSFTWINREDGYITTTLESGAPATVGFGTFQAQAGEWETNTPGGAADQGIYHFMDDNTVVMEGEAGVLVIWTRKPAQTETTAKLFSGRPKVAGFANKEKAIN